MKILSFQCSLLLFSNFLLQSNHIRKRFLSNAAQCYFQLFKELPYMKKMSFQCNVVLFSTFYGVTIYEKDFFLIQLSVIFNIPYIKKISVQCTFYRVWEPVSIRPYMKKISFQCSLVLFYTILKSCFLLRLVRSINKIGLL